MQRSHVATVDHPAAAMPAPVFNVHRSGATLCVSGEVDAAAEQEFRAAAAAGPIEVIDLRRVTFFSAAGVAALRAVQAETAPGAVVLTSPAVDRVFELCGLAAPGRRVAQQGD